MTYTKNIKKAHIVVVIDIPKTAGTYMRPIRDETRA